MSLKFYRGMGFKEENRHVELKDIKGGRPVDSILDTSHEYAVAFLNAGGGSIFWGIDENGPTVKGVLLSAQDRNKIQTILSQKLRAIRPPIPADATSIIIHEVFDKSLETKIEDLFVVEVRVAQGAPDKLYFTGKGQSYIKQEAQKISLGPEEINREIERRVGIQPGKREIIASLFSQINWRHVRMMPLYPPVPISRVHCDVLDEYRVFFSLPHDYLDYVGSGNHRLQCRLNDGRFSGTDIFELHPVLATNKRSLFFDLVEKRDLLEIAKQRVFRDYMSAQGTIKFNGQILGLSAMRQGRTSEERPELTIDLFRSDYYSYRVMGELCELINASGDPVPEYLVRRGLSDFGGSFEQGIHLAAGIAIILHTLHDNRFVITRRSANSTNTADEAGKLFMSANEGLNIKDIPNGSTVNLNDVVLRACREELIGGTLGGPDLPKRLRRVFVTGAYLYGPTLSADICIYATIDCSVTDIKMAYLLAPDSLFETDGFSDCPTASLTFIREYLDKTLNRQCPSSTWDEGALTAFLCAALCLPE